MATVKKQFSFKSQHGSELEASNDSLGFGQFFNDSDTNCDIQDPQLFGTTAFNNSNEHNQSQQHSNAASSAKITEDDLEVTSESRDVVPDELPSEGTKRLQAFKRQHTYWTSVNEATSMHQNNLDNLALPENRIHYDYGSSDSASTSRELNPVSRWSNRLGSIPRKVKGSLLHKSYSVREHPDVRERRTQNQTLLRRCDSLTTRTKERPRSGISIDQLFEGTKRATPEYRVTTDDDDNRSVHTLDPNDPSEQIVNEVSTEYTEMPLFPTYKGIFSRDLRKRATVFGTEAPEVTEVSFSFDSDLRYIRPHTNEFKDRVSRIMVGIVLRHGDTIWKVNKSYSEVTSLHRSLLAARAKSKVKQLAHRATDTSRSFPELPNINRLTYGGPGDSNSSNFGNELRKFQDELWLYLKQLIAFHSNETATFRFLQCSFFSFIKDIGPKQIETTVKGRKTRHEKMFCRRTFKLSGWLLLKDSCLIHAVGARVIDVLLVDRAFEIEKLASNRLRVRNMNKISDYQVYNKQVEPWYESLIRLKNTCEYANIEHLPNSSFAPERPNSRCMFFIDGFKYFQSLYHALMSAREEIFITDWWLTPQYYLIRKYDRNNVHKLDPKYRLDNVLATKAKEGVRIYILLYKEIKWAVGLQSKHAKKVLTSMHPNIKVMRHPYIGTHILWAHHEKLVIVDQLVAYVGGIDICFGRWDDMMHRLTDTGGSDATPIDHNASKTVRMRASHLFMRLPRDSFAEMRHNLTTKARSMSRRKIPKFHKKEKSTDCDSA